MAKSDKKEGRPMDADRALSYLNAKPETYGCLTACFQQTKNAEIALKEAIINLDMSDTSGAFENADEALQSLEHATGLAAAAIRAIRREMD